MTEARVKEDSEIAGQTVSELRKQANQEVMVTAVVRDEQTAAPLPDMKLQANDIVLLQGEPGALERAVARSDLELEGESRASRTEAKNEQNDEIGVIEAVIGPNSLLIGQAAGRLALHDRFNVNLLAVSRSGQRFTERLRDIELRSGDVIVLQGVLAHMPAQLRALGCLPLAARQLRLGSVRRGLIPIAVLVAAMVLAGTGTLSVGIAFFGAGRADDPARIADAARSIRDGRVADPRHARRADSRQRGDSHDRRLGRDRRRRYPAWRTRCLPTAPSR